MLFRYQGSQNHLRVSGGLKIEPMAILLFCGLKSHFILRSIAQIDSLPLII